MSRRMLQCTGFERASLHHEAEVGTPQRLQRAYAPAGHPARSRRTGGTPQLTGAVLDVALTDRLSAAAFDANDIARRVRHSTQNRNLRRRSVDAHAPFNRAGKQVQEPLSPSPRPFVQPLPCGARPDRTPSNPIAGQGLCGPVTTASGHRPFQTPTDPRSNTARIGETCHPRQRKLGERQRRVGAPVECALSSHPKKQPSTGMAANVTGHSPK